MYIHVHGNFICSGHFYRAVNILLHKCKTLARLPHEICFDCTPVTKLNLLVRDLILYISNLVADPPPQQTPPPTKEVMQKAPPTKEVPQAVSSQKPSPREAASPSPSKLKSKRSWMKKKMSMDSNLGGMSPQNGKSHGAPPPPPMERHRTQPEFMSQLASKMAERKKKDDTLEEECEGVEVKGEISDSLTSEDGSIGEWSVESLSQSEAKKGQDSMTEQTPTSILGSPLRSRGALKPRGIPAPLPPSQKQAPPTETLPMTSKQQPPPPVSTKPKKKPRSYSGEDEVDFGGELTEVREGRSTSLRQDLEGAESSITAALMDQAGNRLGR